MTASDRIADLERELAWAADYRQRLERQLTELLDRAYQVETTNARLWAALGMLAGTRGEEPGVVAPDLAAPAWPKVAGEVVRLLEMLSSEGEFTFPPPGVELSSSGIVVPPLTGMNVELRSWVDTPVLPRPSGRPMLGDPVSLVPSRDRVHHAATTGAVAFASDDGPASSTIQLLCRSREVPYLRITIKPDRVRPPSHLMIDTRGWRVVQQMKTPDVRIGLTEAEVHAGWARLALTVETAAAVDAPVQFALSEAPSAFLTHFAGREGQAIDLAWIVVAPSSVEESAGAVSTA